MQIKQAGGNLFQLPTNNAAIDAHCQDPRNHVTTILEQINDQKIYDDVFKYFGNRRDLTVIDAGANIGLFSMYAQDVCQKIYAIEPTPHHMDLLKSITANSANIQPMQIALSNQDADVDFYLCEHNPTMNSVVNNYGQTIKVKGSRLDSFVNGLSEDKIDLLKVDIEGSESIVIDHTVVSAIKDRVSCWLIETHDNPKWNWQDTLTNLAQILHNNGYGVQIRNRDCIWAYKLAGVITLTV